MTQEVVLVTAMSVMMSASAADLTTMTPWMTRQRNLLYQLLLVASSKCSHLLVIQLFITVLPKS